jgi:hypothetical protein
MADKEYETPLVESLKLIVQSQLVLSELLNNQKHLERLIQKLEDQGDPDA